MPFLPPNQQRQSTEGTTDSTGNKNNSRDVNSAEDKKVSRHKS